MRSTPVKVDVLSQDRVVQVVAGADHAAAVTGKNLSRPSEW
jgi:alpha-tubulin suppressor-like RCC1 family protein